MYKFIFIISSLFLLTAYNTDDKTDILNSSSFKITIFTNGEEKEWEYENPDDFEYEEGNTVLKGKKAKTEVLEMYNLLKINEATKVQEIKQKLEAHGYKNMDKFEIRVGYFDKPLLIWKWENNDRS